MTGCTNLDRLSRASLLNDHYFFALANEYLAFSSSEAKQYDWYDSEYFAKKGLRASHGEMVLPETPSDWDLDQPDIARLDKQRRRLMKVIQGSYRHAFAPDVAHAQVLYDCWIEQLEENWQMSDIAECEDNFLSLMTEIEEKIAIKMEAGKKNQPIMIGKESNRENTLSRVVYFGFDSYNIDNIGHQIINQVASFINNLTDYTVSVKGHTDSYGTANYNLGLSKKRADSVADLLQKKGVNSSKISVTAHGESMLALDTKDQVSEIKNRRVEIQVESSSNARNE